MVMPISRFAAGPVKDDTKRTTRSPSVQHWWARDGLELDDPWAELRGYSPIERWDFGARGRARH